MKYYTFLSILFFLSCDDNQENTLSPQLQNQSQIIPTEETNEDPEEPNESWGDPLILTASVSSSGVTITAIGSVFTSSSNHFYHLSILKEGHNNNYTDRHGDDDSDWATTDHHYGDLHSNTYIEGRLLGVDISTNIDVQFLLPFAAVSTAQIPNMNGSGLYFTGYRYATGNGPGYPGLNPGNYTVLFTPVYGLDEPDINHTSNYTRIIDTHSNESISVSFSIPEPTIESGPLLLLPTNSTTITNSTAHFSWSAVSGASNYTLDINGVTHNSNTDTISISNLSNGSYSWKVKANLTAGGSTDWSLTRSFFISIANPTSISISGPILVYGPSNQFPTTIYRTYTGSVTNPPTNFSYEWYKQTSGNWLPVGINSSYTHSFSVANSTYQIELRLDIINSSTSTIVATSSKLVTIEPNIEE